MKKNKMTLIPSITILLKWPWPAFIIKVSHFADFEQVIIKISDFADFEQVIEAILSTKLPWEKPDTKAFFLRPLPCVTGTPPWLLRPMKASTSSELYPNTGLFFECLGIRFFNSSHVTYGHHAVPEVTHTHT